MDRLLTTGIGIPCNTMIMGVSFRPIKLEQMLCSQGLQDPEQSKNMPDSFFSPLDDAQSS